MPSHDFTFRSDADGRAVIHRTLAEAGWEVASTPTGGFLATRGSVARTVLLGALAGSGFRQSLMIDFMQAPNGAGTVARLHRDMGGSALKGGVIGAAKARDTFEQTANAIHAALEQERILVGSVANR